MAVVAPIVSTFDRKGVDKAERAFGGLQDSAGRTFGKIADFAKVAATAVAGIGIAGVVGAGKAISAASDLDEAVSKVGVIFGDVSGDVEAFAAEAAGALGQSQIDALNAASTFATFGKAAGLAGDDLFGFATDFTTLASDLASFNNTTPEDAVNAIGAALRGESEPLRRYGILLDDATLKAEALALGIYDGEGALSASQKTLAAERAIYRQASDAQGDFARTSGGLANQQRILKARLDNVVVEIGRKFLPVALKLATFFSEKVLPAIELVSKAFSEDGFAGVFRLVSGLIEREGPKIVDAGRGLLERLGRWILDTGLPYLLDKLRQLGKALVDWIGPRIRPALEKLGELIGRLANWVIDEGVPMLVAKLQELGDKLVAWIGPRIRPALEELGKFLASILRWIGTDAVPKLVTEATKLGVSIIGWVFELAPDVLRGLGSAIVSIVREIPGVFVSLVTAMLNAGKSLGSALLDGLKNGMTGLLGRAGDFAESVKNAFVNALKSGWNNIVARPVNSAVKGAVNALDSLLGPFVNFDDPPDLIPRLAEGGIVSSPTLALIGDRKLSQGRNTEAVVPLDKMGGGITINVTGALDPTAVARQIRQLLERDAARLGLRSAV